jgi:alanyl-tRNA synthetase
VTERLYYHDSYQREFRAHLVDSSEDGRRVYLDRTLFYPASGGQPFDTGTLGSAAVLEVVDEEDRIAHLLDAPLKSVEVEGSIDWARRFDHMQQHTGQHLLSAVLMDLFDIRTLSFHMGPVVSTIEVSTPALESKRIERVEERCGEIVAEARPVVITFEDAAPDLGLRKASERTGTLRIVSMEGLDRSACGGTHVRSTAEIGPILIRKLDKVRGNARLEFVCGSRALSHARQDFRTLSELSRTLSVSFEDAPGLVAAQLEKIKTLEKSLLRLTLESAQREGRDLYQATAPDDAGVRRAVQRGPIDAAMRARAQAFAAGSKSVFLAVSQDPPSVLLATSPDSGINAGECVTAAVTGMGGRGGGNPSMAQGSVPGEAALEAVVRSLSC